MPCTDGGIPYPPTREEELNAKAPAMLCAIVSTLAKECTRVGFVGIMSRVDWHEAGVTHAEFEEWWRIHQLKDAARREQEAQAQHRRELRDAALSKLSPAERDALGLHQEK